MTREEASYILRKFYADGYKSNNFNALEKALKIAVICLEDLPHWISVEFPHWISVKDELPPKQPNREQSKNVLVRTNSGRTKIGYYDYGNDVIKEWWEYNITHWMPLPQPPKEGCELSNGKEIEIECDYE